jgi:hypothetical protein
MSVHLPTPGAIVVVTAEDDRFKGALRRATELAAGRREPLILYDWDAPSLFSDPLPTWWSSEGWDRQVPDRLGPEQLDAAGRGAIADQVRSARRTGVEAFGWLPSDRDADSLATYATGQKASMIVVPRDVPELDALGTAIHSSPREHAVDGGDVRTEVATALVVV